MTTATAVDRPALEAALGRATAALEHAGLGAGDVVCSVLPNDVAAFAVGWACALAGVVQVPVSSTMPAPEVRSLVLASGATTVLVDPAEGLPTGLPAVVDELGLTVVRTDVGTVREPAADAPRTRAMAFTSGTTGRRKGVVVGVHGPEWGRTVLDDEAAAFEGRHGDRHLVVSPLTHSGPFRHALTVADAGGTVDVLPRFTVEGWLDALRRVRPTSMFCVPTQLHRLLAHPGLRPGDLSSLTLLVHAGAPCPVPLKHRLLDLAPDGAVWEFYGSTEGQFSVCPPDLWHGSPGTVGRARPGRTLTVRDGTGAPLDPDAVGTVWTTAPEHARWTYLDAPAETEAAWDDDAFTVGDLGHLSDDGLLTLDGRPGDLVVTGGVNVYPAEVERVLVEHPGVGEAVAFGVPDEEWGQRLVAAVTVEPGAQRPDPDAIRQALRERLPAARVPKHVAIVDELPRTATGKIRRTALPGMVAP